MFSSKTPFVGLTGGIGSGKTVVSDLFAQQGVPIVDTDVIAHELSQTEPFLSEVHLAFGDSVFDQNGQINRAQLRQIVFSDQANKKKLENIAHPMIRIRAIKQMSAINAEYGILVVPLLFETAHFLNLVKRVLVVDCGENTQIQRVIIRSKMTEAQVRAIIKQQVSRETRLMQADDVIENDSEQDRLELSVKQLHQFYLYYFKQRKGRTF